MAKKLDQGNMEFDLSVKDATTQQEYADDAMILPRGARLVVQRLPAARGHGILSKIRNMTMSGGAAGVAGINSAHGGTTASGGGGGTVKSDWNGLPTVPDNFYTLSSSAQEDEFVTTADQELAALRAATTGMNHHQNASGNPILTRTVGGGPPTGPGTGMAVRGRGMVGGLGGLTGGRGTGAVGPPRRLADPELQEKQPVAPKKRATGIPRTFLSLSAPNADDSTPLLQPNVIGFEELVNRAGGQSAVHNKRDLDYALKLTATTIPEYLQCALCHSVVKDAMMVPWDPDGRTVCELCIRDALTKSGFRCPLTQQEGVSPDDLLPNRALRKAAEQFVQKVLQQMEEIENTQVPEDDFTSDPTTAGNQSSSSTNAGNLLEGDGADKGVIVTKRTSAAERRKKQEDDDPFGADDDDFGGDVFAIPEPQKVVEEDPEGGGGMTKRRRFTIRPRRLPPKIFL